MVKTLDLRQFSSGKSPEAFTAALGEACRQSGVFLLTEHGIPRALLREVLEEADRFFALPCDEKTALDIRKFPGNRGWAGEGVEVLSGRKDQPLHKESFSIGLDLAPNDPRVLAGEPFRAANVWPDLDSFRDVMRDYYKEMLGLGRMLMRAVERDLSLPGGFFQSHYVDPMATLRLSHYPADPWGLAAWRAECETGSLSADAGLQYDYGGFTVVLTDGSGGMQYRDLSGQWRDVPDVPGALLVMVGDCLMRWSNGIYRSAPHRLAPPSKTRRLAAFYFDPHPDSLVAPLPGTGEPEFTPVRAADYLSARLQEIYLQATAAQ
nr:2-oxoglutarate and iron-dependent oxygenase domain-containing protein [uncultured Celeribacter sp.]